MKRPRVLVIKLGALGDFVQAIGPMQRIRAAHPEAELTLLTTPAYAALGQATGLFDRIDADGRPSGLPATLRMLRRLRRARYQRVYDLQTNARSSAYFQALRPSPPEWSGIASGASHPHRNPERDRMHTAERQAEQLREAGVWPDAPTTPGAAPGPDLGALLAHPAPDQRPEHFGLERPYALLVPGAAPSRPLKRWPAERYGALAQRLSDRLQVAVIGGPAESEAARIILQACPAALDLTGRTDYAQIAALGAQATLAVGNDTGPIQLIAAAGAPTLVLFSAESDPALCAPRSERVEVISVARLDALSVDAVHAQALRLLDWS